MLSTLTMSGRSLPLFQPTVSLQLNAHALCQVHRVRFTRETFSGSVSFGGHDPGSAIVLLSTLASEYSLLGTLLLSSYEDDDILSAMIKLGSLSLLPRIHSSTLDPSS